MKAVRLRYLVSISILLAASLIAIFTVNIEVKPPDSTRIILEKTYGTYISPPCFDNAQSTNNISESNLVKAVELNYRPDSKCTETSLKGINKTIYIAALEKLGLIEGSWDW
jgi:hypothetical protein